jgi:hypothetical protein
MKVSDAFPSRYLKAADLNEKKLTLTITRYEIEEMGENNETKPVLYFEKSQKGLVLNKTNAVEISEAYGDEMNSWKGRRITLVPVRVTFKGERKAAIRVLIPLVAEGKERVEIPPKEPKPDEQNDDDTRTAQEMDDEIPF